MRQLKKQSMNKENLWSGKDMPTDSTWDIWTEIKETPQIWSKKIFFIKININSLFLDLKGLYSEKQAFRGLLLKRCSEKFR